MQCARRLPTRYLLLSAMTHSVCCRVLQCVSVFAVCEETADSKFLSLCMGHAVCCSVLQCVAVCQETADSTSFLSAMTHYVLQRVAVCCSVPVDHSQYPLLSCSCSRLSASLALSLYLLVSFVFVSTATGPLSQLMPHLRIPMTLLRISLTDIFMNKFL